MSNCPHSKRKREEQSAEEPVVVRRSARQKDKGQEPILKRAMNRKKANSLEFDPPKSSEHPQRGSDPAAQANSTGMANMLQQDQAADTDHPMNQSRVALAGSNCVFPEEGSTDLNSLSHNSQSTSFLDLVLQSSPEHEELPSLPTTTSATPKFNAQGLHGASSSTSVPPKDGGTYKLLSSWQQGPCMTGFINLEGNAAPVNPASEIATRRPIRSHIAGSSHICNQAAQAGSIGVANAGPSYGNNMVLHSAIPPSTAANARVVNPSFQNTCIPTQGIISAAQTNPAGRSAYVNPASRRPKRIAIAGRGSTAQAHAGYSAHVMSASRRPNLSSHIASFGQAAQPVNSRVDIAGPSNPNPVPSFINREGINHSALTRPAAPRTPHRSRTNTRAPQAIAGPFNPKSAALNSQMMSSLSINDAHPPIPPSAPVGPKVVSNRGLQNVPICSGRNKGITVSTPGTVPSMQAPNVPSQGRTSSERSSVPLTKARVDELLSMLGGTRSSTANLSHLRKLEDHDKDNAHKHKNINETDGTNSSDLNKKPVPPSSRSKQIYYIKAAPHRSPEPPPLLPLGERCQLCRIDLAFSAQGSDTSRSNDPPFAAVLPCGHAYHDYCLRELFGPNEPPCVKCLESEAP